MNMFGENGKKILEKKIIYTIQYTFACDNLICPKSRAQKSKQ